jgi:hypothetical protein
MGLAVAWASLRRSVQNTVEDGYCTKQSKCAGGLDPNRLRNCCQSLEIFPAAAFLAFDRMGVKRMLTSLAGLSRIKRRAASTRAIRGACDKCSAQRSRQKRLPLGNSNSPRYAATERHVLNSRRLRTARQQSRSRFVAIITPLELDVVAGTSPTREPTRPRRLCHRAASRRQNARRFEYCHASRRWRKLLQT